MKNKNSDLSVYDKPFDINSFVFSTPTTVRKLKLSKEGFSPIILKLKSNGEWYCLAYISGNGDKRWVNYKKDFVENYLTNLPEDVIMEELL